MLWAFDPVKYCSAALQTDAGTTRRSTWMPFVVTTDDLVGPWARMRSTKGSVQKADDLVSAVCECGTHELSRAEMKHAIDSHQCTILLT